MSHPLVESLLPLNSRRRKLAVRLRRLVRRDLHREHVSFHQWIEQIEPLTVAPPAMGTYRPLISVVVPAYNTPDKYLNPLIDSVLAQTYDHWELILVDGSTNTERSSAIHAIAKRDHRIKLVIQTGNDHGIAANTNIGLKAATGEYIGLLDHDDILAPSALNEVVHCLQEDPTIDWFYSDEDKLSDDGAERMPFLFKPDWSPELFYAVNYVTHFMVVRRELMDMVGGIRPKYEGAQDFDLCLRLLDHKPRIKHIAKILYHWRYAEGSTAIHPRLKAKLEDAGVRALNEFLKRNKVNATAEGVPDAPSNYHVMYATPGNPKASLIIPFKDKSEVTKVMVDSILALTDYPNYEIILIDNRSELPETAAYLATLKGDKRIKIVSYDEPFNWSAVNNFGRRQASGKVMTFLNNDMRVENASWLRELVGVALQPEIGAVGALLRYPDGSVQHAGITLGLFGVAGHIFRTRTTGDFTLFGLADWPRNYLAITGACIAVEADKFDRLTGFDENFITAGSDVAFGIKLHEAGLRNVYWPFANLTHFEGISVGVYNQRSDTQNDYDESMKYYTPYLEGRDPYFNPNLELYDLASERVMIQQTGPSRTSMSKE